MRQLLRALPALYFCVAIGTAQTTQGLISGKLQNSQTGKPVAAATVTFSSALTNLGGAVQSDASGTYYLPLLSPGVYSIRVTADAYQAQEIQQLELTVAARVELDFRLRPLSDVWEAGQYNSVLLPGSRTIVTFFGPDVDTTKSGSFDAQKGRAAPLESTVSEVIDQGLIQNLPLEGRDVYALLLTQPGVTSDTATGRGLGLAVNGTRPTSSNFLLDGVENNNYLTTGPLTSVSPEAIQEYRISTNNYSAEYGRTAGFLANAITRSGSDTFHGLGYFYLKNDVLDANGFQENLQGKPRNPEKEIRPGYYIGGPVLKGRLYFSSAFEYLRSRSFQDAFPFLLPSTAYLQYYTQPTSAIRTLLGHYPAPVVNNGLQPLGTLFLRPTSSLNQQLGIERVDYIAKNGDRVMARGIFRNLTRPDFQWSPYKDFLTPLVNDTWDVAGSYIHAFRSDLTNEARASYSDDDLHFNRPNSAVPTLNVAAPFGALNPFNVPVVSLPGSLGFYSYLNHSRSTELLDNLLWTHGRHFVTVGAGLLLRGINGYLTAGQDPEYTFSSIFALGSGTPTSVTVGLDRLAYLSGQAVIPNYNRDYNYHQFFLFAQDTFKVTRRMTVNYGLRYEYFGAPLNTGTVKDVLPRLGAGASSVDQVASAVLTTQASGDQALFGTDKHDVAVRVGAAFDLFGNGKTLLRGAFGTFYDRPFDNLWENLRNNRLFLPLGGIPIPFNSGVNYLNPISSVLSTLNSLGATQNLPSDFPNLTLVDPHLKNGRIYSYFAGVEHRVTDNLYVEVNALGTYGRNLLSNDILNRDFTTLTGRPNPNLGNVNIYYQSDQGFSNYNAMTAVVRYRTQRGFAQASYTWSHWIDNQSDPLAGQFFDLSFVNVSSANPGSNGVATFTIPSNPNYDKGNSDFDQRHNLVLFGYYALPAPFRDRRAGIVFRDWGVSALAALRSGMPYTVIGTSGIVPGVGVIYNPRPDILDPTSVTLANSTPVIGGRQLLNPAAFAANANGLGNEGRNAFTGPGLYNVDVSVSRSFPLRWLGEAGRLVLRADAFNVLNHANLNNPDPFLGDSTFGQASYGRVGLQTGFPAQTPLNETARQVQLLLRLQF